MINLKSVKRSILEIFVHSITDFVIIRSLVGFFQIQIWFLSNSNQSMNAPIIPQNLEDTLDTHYLRIMDHFVLQKILLLNSKKVVPVSYEFTKFYLLLWFNNNADDTHSEDKSGSEKKKGRRHRGERGRRLGKGHFQSWGRSARRGWKWSLWVARFGANTSRSRNAATLTFLDFQIVRKTVKMKF